MNLLLTFKSSFLSNCSSIIYNYFSLIADIKKHTSDDNPDKITLEKAIESLKEVMTWVWPGWTGTLCIYGPMNLIDMFVLLSHINEDKRKTEGQKQIFDVVYEVDGCPVSEFMLLCSDTWVYQENWSQVGGGAFFHSYESCTVWRMKQKALSFQIWDKHYCTLCSPREAEIAQKCFQKAQRAIAQTLLTQQFLWP